MVLPAPDFQQRQIIDALAVGKNVQCTAVAGAGKTTLLLWSAYALQPYVAFAPGRSGCRCPHTHGRLPEPTGNRAATSRLPIVAAAEVSIQCSKCGRPIRRTRRNVLLVCYNVQLSVDTRARLKSWKQSMEALPAIRSCRRRGKLLPHVQVLTFHALLGFLMGRPVMDDAALMLALQDLIAHGPVREIPKQGLWDTIYVDEMQDCRAPYIVLLQQVARWCCGRREVQWCVVGDPFQLVADFHQTHPASEHFLLHAPQYLTGGADSDKARPWVQHRLDYSHRLTPHMAALVNNCVRQHDQPEKRLESAALLPPDPLPLIAGNGDEMPVMDNVAARSPDETLVGNHDAPEKNHEDESDVEVTDDDDDEDGVNDVDFILDEEVGEEDDSSRESLPLSSAPNVPVALQPVDMRNPGASAKQIIKALQPNAQSLLPWSHCLLLTYSVRNRWIRSLCNALLSACVPVHVHGSETRIHGAAGLRDASTGSAMGDRGAAKASSDPASGSLLVTTFHAAKGLTRERVVVLLEQWVWDKGMFTEPYPNVVHVALTRARAQLTIMVNSTGPSPCGLGRLTSHITEGHMCLQPLQNAEESSSLGAAQQSQSAYARQQRRQPEDRSLLALQRFHKSLPLPGTAQLQRTIIGIVRHDYAAPDLCRFADTGVVTALLASLLTADLEQGGDGQPQPTGMSEAQLPSHHASLDAPQCFQAPACPQQQQKRHRRHAQNPSTIYVGDLYERAIGWFLHCSWQPENFADAVDVFLRRAETIAQAWPNTGVRIGRLLTLVQACLQRCQRGGEDASTPADLTSSPTPAQLCFFVSILEDVVNSEQLARLEQLDIMDGMAWIDEEFIVNGAAVVDRALQSALALRQGLPVDTVATSEVGDGAPPVPGRPSWRDTSMFNAEVHASVRRWPLTDPARRLGRDYEKVGVGATVDVLLPVLPDMPAGAKALCVTIVCSMVTTQTDQLMSALVAAIYGSRYPPAAHGAGPPSGPGAPVTPMDDCCPCLINVLTGQVWCPLFRRQESDDEPSPAEVLVKELPVLARDVVPAALASSKCAAPALIRTLVWSREQPQKRLATPNELQADIDALYAKAKANACNGKRQLPPLSPADQPAFKRRPSSRHRARAWKKIDSRPVGATAAGDYEKEVEEEDGPQAYVFQ